MAEPIGNSDWRWQYATIDVYVPLEDARGWELCPVCLVHPRIWIFDNGRYAKCCCVLNRYSGAEVAADSINSSLRHNGRSGFYYDSDALRKNWNFHVSQLRKES